MSTLRLILCNLLYFWRTNLAVMAGVVAGTAVIAGALIVGDSVRDSLTQMSLDRLGEIHHVLHGPRFVREELAGELNRKLNGNESEQGARPTTVAPAIVLTSTALFTNRDGRTLRAGRVQLYGVDDRLWGLTDHRDIVVPVENEAVLNQKLADELGVKAGDEVSLMIEIPASIPRDSLLGDRDQTVTELLVKVRAVAGDELGLSRLGLNPSQQLPANAYVSLQTLQQQLGLNEVLPTRRSPVGQKGRVNALFVRSWHETDRETPADASSPPVANVEFQAAADLNMQLRSVLTLSDLGLNVVTHELNQGAGEYLSVESTQMILDRFTSEVADEIADEQKLLKSPVLVYLLNRIGTPVPDESTGKSREYSMYSVAAGIDFATQDRFGLLDFLEGKAPDAGEADGTPTGTDIPIVINQWLADDLKGGPDDGELIELGARIPLRYYVVGDRGDLPEAEITGVVVGIVRMTGGAIDRGFTPDVPGVTDVESYSDWREPFPLDREAITQSDHDYWKAHRATPKILLRLPDAQRLWRSRYGDLTSFRVASHASETGKGEGQAAQEVSSQLLAGLSPDKTGLAFQPVREMGILAARGTTDFSGLFLGFSMFLIAAATLLIGILFRLGIERRVQELGLYGALGLAPGQVRRLFLGEGGAVCVMGGLLGIPAAIGYAHLMVYGLKTWWIGAIGTRFLFVSIHASSLVVGVTMAVCVAMGAIGWSMWQLRKLSHRQLMAGVTTNPLSQAGQQSRRRVARGVTIASWGVMGVLLTASLFRAIPASEAFGGFSWQTVTFFLTGFATLIGCLSLFASWLDIDCRNTNLPPASRLSQLSIRNAGRQRGRSVMTACLIAFAAFVIVAVAAGRRNPTVETPVRASGNGGFAIVAETSLPTLYDPSTATGRTKLGFDSLANADRKQLEQLRYFRFRARFGEDASCLNLYETSLPTILGVPADILELLIAEERFRFADARGTNPWTALRDGHFIETTSTESSERETPSTGGGEGGAPIAVLGDLNTLQYSLHKGIGSTISLPDSILSQTGLAGTELKVAGMLDSSIFQGVLLMSERNFQRLFPDQVGFRYFLVDTSSLVFSPEGVETPAPGRGETERVIGLLESALVNVGLDAEPVSERLASYLSVQNTYLSTFQTLGGLGLLLGTLGLATVMLRNVLDRRAEIALFRAIGFANRRVARMVAIENAVVLLVGLLTGTLSALLAMAPHLLSTGADTPWQGLLTLLAIVITIGMLAPLLAIREAVRSPILGSLRGE